MPAKKDAKDIVVGVAPAEEGKAVGEEVAGTIGEMVVQIYGLFLVKPLKC